uniref:MFS domain-containing protein n=1 Tax=Panagrellus redivivus TaxID=6233 RepID=A0A7E4ZX60_PANRE
MSSYRSPDDPYQPTTFTKHPQANGSNGYAPVQTTSQKPANGNGKTDEFPFEDDVFLTDYEPIIAVMTEDDPDILETHAHDKPVDEEHPKNYGDFISFGWYTFFFMFAYELLMLPQVGNMTFMLYGAYTPQVVACGNTTFTDMPQRDVCKILPEIMNTTGCVPTIESQFGSLGAEFGWYCDTAKQVKKAVSVQMFGVFIGAPIMGQASDLFGRRRVVLWCLAFIFVLDMLAVRTVGLVDFTIVQTINMVFVGGMSTAMHVYLAESIHKKHRVWVMMLLSFSPNMVIFAVIAYFAQNWRTLMLISGIMTVPAFLALLLRLRIRSRHLPFGGSAPGSGSGSCGPEPPAPEPGRGSGAAP